jgi:hypothetical protein
MISMALEAGIIMLQQEGTIMLLLWLGIGERTVQSSEFKVGSRELGVRSR